ncbi:MAG: F0F1 ATP synthase subunit A [Planctomycetes bacterium]|nr:F0F1 ATP synthase subunit A [Planctomycetota bacterium]
MSAGDPFHHVRDTNVWEIPGFVLDALGMTSYPALPTGLTKYMVLQVVAVVLSLVIFRGLATRVRGGKPVSGAWWNFWETLALFIRDQVVRPSVGIPHHHHDHGHDDHAHDAGSHGHGHVHNVGGSAVVAGAHAVAVDVGHPADKYLPFVWSVFFYILFCNLLGAIPFLGSPTADINVTGALALVTFAHVAFFGSERSGPVGFLKALVPSMDLPGPIAFILLPGIWVIEAGGLLIKHGVLAVRLFANIMAGHTVLGVFLGFIAVANGPIWGIVMPASIIGQVAIGMLELFVAFLQAYVFALLASLFISAAVNPH